MMKNMFGKLFICAVTAVLMSNAAYAGCNPKCPEGQVCRYAAEADKEHQYYCAPEPTNPGVKGPSKGLPKAGQALPGAKVKPKAKPKRSAK